MQQHASPFFDLLHAQVALEQREKAFDTLERTRARALVELLNERSHAAQSVLSAVAPDLDRQQQSLLQQRRSLAHRLAFLGHEHNRPEAQLLDDQIKALDVEQRKLESTIRHTIPHYAALTSPLPLSCAQAQQTLDKGTLCLAFAVGDKQSYLFALTKTQIEVYLIAIDRQTLEQEVSHFRSYMQNPRSDYPDCLKTARQLYEHLLKPAQQQIDAAQRLLICPDGILHTLPFAALIASSPKQPVKYLVEVRPLHVIVSLSLYRELRATPVSHSGNILALADPDYTANNILASAGGGSAHDKTAGASAGRGQRLPPLSPTRQQVETLQRLYGARVKARIGKMATTTAIWKEGKDASILHIACHGALNNADPLSSSLALSSSGKDNGRLTAYDILGMHLPCDLVMLSACETGRGKQTEFEGVIGLTRAFQYAGARSVGVSLWSVDAMSTTALMDEFYRRYQKDTRKDVALQQAQIALIHDRAHSDWHHPFFWAAFQIVGDWK